MTRYTKKDWVLAAVVTLIVFTIGACSLRSGLKNWGDDSSAYISEGISIAEGSFQQQIRMNYYYHPSQLPSEAADSASLVYVWGYPLLLALVYKLVGFSFDAVIWYKLPLLLSLSLTGGALVLFYRRRFPRSVAFAAAFLFCMSGDLLPAVNELYSDLPFLFFSVLTFLLMECLCERPETDRRGIVLGLCYGVTLWMTYETRLSGAAVCAAAFAGHALACCGRAKEKPRALRLQLLPYAILLLLILLSERLWLAPATSNLSDLSEKGFYFKYYYDMLRGYLAELFGMHIGALGYLFLLLFALGVVSSGFRKKNLPLTVLVFGTFIVASHLPYNQGLRYLYNILPFVLMYTVYGLLRAVDRLRGLWARYGARASGVAAPRCILAFAEKHARKAALVLVLCALLFSCAKPVERAIDNLSHWGEKSDPDVFSDAAAEVYEYIREQLPAESVIAFGKPRALYLNTGCASFRPGANGHTLSEADYYLQYKYYLAGHVEPDLGEVSYEILFDNAAFTLYRLNNCALSDAGDGGRARA